jgi:spermidine/putrescine transport system ATP-binding protein
MTRPVEMGRQVAEEKRQRSLPASDPAQDVDVRLEGVSKHFGDVQALRPTTLSISRGEFFSLLGASGSGKTTTLRIIAGFEEPTTGRVYLRGRDVTACAPYERNVNTVFQDYALFPHMNVEDNIGYGLRVRHVDRKEIKRRVHEALELVRLPGFEKRRPSQLSGGQRQRVALARALVNVPAVLLLDEPLGALDFKLRREMQFELKRIQKDVGITFLYVTHDQEEAMSMSDRVAVMTDGQIVQVGTPTDVYEHPTNAFVAGFVGVSNILECVVERRDDSTLTVTGPSSTRLRVPAHGDVAPGQTVLVTIRPEKIRLLRTEIDGVSQSNVVPGTITDVSYAGALTRYTVRARELEMAVVAQNEGAGPSAHVGEEVWLSWPVQQSYLISIPDDNVQWSQREASPVER